MKNKDLKVRITKDLEDKQVTVEMSLLVRISAKRLFNVFCRIHF